MLMFDPFEGLFLEHADDGDGIVFLITSLDVGLNTLEVEPKHVQEQRVLPSLVLSAAIATSREHHEYLVSRGNLVVSVSGESNLFCPCYEKFGGARGVSPYALSPDTV